MSGHVQIRVHTTEGEDVEITVPFWSTAGFPHDGIREALYQAAGRVCQAYDMPPMTEGLADERAGR